MSVKVGASYENMLSTVPTTDWTATPIARLLENPPGAVQTRTELAVQLAVAQYRSAIATLGVVSKKAKFVPEREIGPPDAGVFAGSTDVAAGASYEKAARNVDEIAPSVTDARRALPEPRK